MMALPMWWFVEKVFTIPRKGKHRCHYCMEKMTIIHNRHGQKVNDFEIKFCFHCGKKLR